MKSLIAPFVIAASLVLSQEAASSSLEDYVEEALAHNHELAAARAAAVASQEAVRRSGSLPDPVLGLQYYVEPVETRTGPQEAAISLSQKLPWPTKLSLQKDEARRQTAVVESKVQEASLRVVRQVKEAYVDYAFNGEAQRISQEGLELLRYFESVALSRYSAGKLEYANVLKIQVESARLQERLRSLREEVVPLRVRLNTLLGAPRDTARQVPQALPQVRLVLAEQGLHGLAEQKSPRLVAARQEVAKAKTSLALAEKEYYPDLALSLKTIVTGEAEYADPPDSGRDPVIAGISITLPLFRERRHGAVAEKQEQVRASQGGRQQLQRNVEADIDQALYSYRDAQRRQELYEQSILPKIRQELEVGLQTFQDGRHSVLALLDSEKNLLDAELAQRRALAEQAKEVARLEEIVGVSLADWQEAEGHTAGDKKG